MADHLEVEDKLEAPLDDTPLPALDEVAGVASVAAPEHHELEATYVDTEDLALARAHITLRRRTGGDDAGWHAKLPAGDARWEVHAPLGEADVVPMELRTLLQGVTRAVPLVPVALVRTHRTVVRLLGEDGSVLAEVADDRVTAQSPPGAAETPRAWREWEVELVDGGRPLLLAVTARLSEAGAGPAPTESKLQRALGDRAPREAGPASGAAADEDTDRAVVVLGARLRDLVAEVHAQDPLARADAPDAVHAMRVAVRRLRSALATYRPLLDRTSTDPLRVDLRWVTERLAEARDDEVLRQSLLARLDGLPTDQVRGGVRAFVDAELRTAHRRAHERAVESLSTERYFGLLDRLDALATDPPWRDGAEHADLAVLRHRVRHDLKRVQKAVAALDDGPVEERASRLHAVRKAARRARYAAEPLVAVDGKSAKRFVRAMKSVQSTLGDHQDDAVARRALRSLGDRATTTGENAYTLGLLEAAVNQDAAGRRGEFRKAWAKADRTKVSRWTSS